MKSLVIHGPNLNLLGKREPDLYGTKTLDEINGLIRAHAKGKSISVECFQTNHEGEIIDRIQSAASEGPGKCDALIINPGAYSHYSIAIRDAIKAIDIPAIEVHLSNICARGPLREKSVIAPACRGQIVGLGHMGYLLAVDAFAQAEK
jgi:3-dehydroquinate dehydratase-2